MNIINFLRPTSGSGGGAMHAGNGGGGHDLWHLVKHDTGETQHTEWKVITELYLTRLFLTKVNTCMNSASQDCC